MKLSRAFGITVAVLSVSLLAMAPSQAFAAYSCKGDRKLDVPMQFAATVQGSGRVHVSAYGGADKSKSVGVSTWRIYDAANVQVDYFPKTMVVFVSMNMFRETNLDGLEPGATYTIELTSKDFCNNLGIVKKTVTMPTGGVEPDAPELSPPALVQVGLQSFFTQIQFSTEDQSGVREVSVFIDGIKVAGYRYSNSDGIRWYTDYYPDDNTLSTLEGPNYYVSYPDTYKGQSALVEVVVTDVLGNQAVESAVLGL